MNAMSKNSPKLAEKDIQDIKRAVERGLKAARQQAQKKGMKGYQQYKTLLEDELSTVSQRLNIPTYEGK